MPDRHLHDAEWLSVSTVARQFNKTRQTIHNWCVSGFILTLGYQVRRDPQGIWFLLPPAPATHPPADRPATRTSNP